MGFTVYSFVLITHTSAKVVVPGEDEIVVIVNIVRFALAQPSIWEKRGASVWSDAAAPGWIQGKSNKFSILV